MIIVKSEIIRAKYLVLNGRFQNNVLKMSSRFEKLDSKETITIGQTKYSPYYDTKAKQVVYAHEDKDNIHYLTFSQADYNFGNTDSFEWFDA